ncbi:MAG TPA: hypothetical protein VF625_03275 [Longimicrobium sp.]|jgi:hypothetical protein
MRSLLVPLAAALFGAAAPTAAQRPVEEYEPNPRYSTVRLVGQASGGGRDRDFLEAFGRLRPRGERGAWMPWLEAEAGFTPGRDFARRFLAGPRATLARAFPSQFMMLGDHTRGEPYLSLGAGAYGVLDVERRVTAGAAPFLAAGVGMRSLADPWEVDLAAVELTVERRFGMNDGAVAVSIRIGVGTPGKMPS